jgi:hypothetical protein
MQLETAEYLTIGIANGSSILLSLVHIFSNPQRNVLILSQHVGSIAVQTCAIIATVLKYKSGNQLTTEKTTDFISILAFFFRYILFS